MNKRYQVFVSSTYADLKDERQSVIQTLMEMDCIPAGMELFPAMDEEQLKFIQKIIDDCDYYILIIGARYGSMTEDGISYTEKEYDYAIAIGLKVLAFIHEAPDELPAVKSDRDDELREKLSLFREKVQAGRLVKFWTVTNQLPGLVALSLSKTIKTYPAVGWVRANTVTSTETLQDLNELRKENDQLRAKIAELSSAELPPDLNLAQLDELFAIRYSWSFTLANWETSIAAKSVEWSWSDIFAAISPGLSEHPTDSKVNGNLASAIYRKEYPKDPKEPASLRVQSDDFETIRIQLETLGLISTKYNQTTRGTMALVWSMSTKGKQLMLSLRTVSSAK